MREVILKRIEVTFNKEIILITCNEALAKYKQLLWGNGAYLCFVYDTGKMV